MQKRFTDFLETQKTKLTIEMLYQRNKSKGIDKDFIEFLINQNQTEAIKLINSAHSKEEIFKLFKDNLDLIKSKYGYIFTCYVTGYIYESYDASLNLIPISIARHFLSHDYNKSDLESILTSYSDVLIKYINNHKSMKHDLLDKEKLNGFFISDFRQDITLETFKKLCSLLSKKVDLEDSYAKEIFSRLIVSLLSVYDKETITNNPDFVKYEIEYGYFDKYYALLEAGKELPPMSERIKKYEEEKLITSEQSYRLSQIDLLEKRISTLESSSKNLMLEKIKLIRLEPDIRKRAELIDSCFAYYEEKFRSEIVDSLYTPTSSTEITDFRDLDFAMLHIFMRDPQKKLPAYEDKVKSDIISSRPVKVTGEEELTPEEQDIYQAKIQYAIEVLLNPVITSESLDMESLYSDSSGLRWYKSDTTNQLSTSVLSINIISRIGNCVGVGFDKKSISPENIIISCSSYQTTNMGVENLEVRPEYRFKAFSSPLAELKDSRKTEVVLYRKKDNVKTNASYVFAIINGFNKKQDEDTIERARKYATENNIRLIIFNNKKILKSYEEFLSTQEEPEQTHKMK
ncbi:MAG TPA: hypothetical protein DCE23_01725 [Firmicutes bacterium]|nr:hypothetical protein [Bacillota bacterium]